MDIQELIKYGSYQYKPDLSTNDNYYGYNRGESSPRTCVIVVGCGGTGGRIIPLLCQHLSNHNKTYSEVPNNNLYLKHKMELLLIDDDTVNF